MINNSIKFKLNIVSGWTCVNKIDDVIYLNRGDSHIGKFVLIDMLDYNLHLLQLIYVDDYFLNKSFELYCSPYDIINVTRKFKYNLQLLMY